MSSNKSGNQLDELSSTMDGQSGTPGGYAARNLIGVLNRYNIPVFVSANAFYE